MAVNRGGRLIKDYRKCSSDLMIQDCGMVLEEQPAKVSEAFRLFLQGQGYALRVSRKSLSASSAEVAPLTENKMANYRRASLEALDVVSKMQTQTPAPHWSASNINITENPISEAVVC